MPEAILAGVDGRPAVDQATGLPLTMEELLRRRGILSVKGVVSPLNQNVTPVDAASAAETALADASNATANNSSGSNIAIGASPSALDDTGTPVGATAATPKLDAKAVEESPSPGSSIGDWWQWLLGGAAAGAGAYAASRIGKGTPTATEAVAAGMRAGKDYTVNDSLQRTSPVIEGKYRTIGSNRKLDALADGRNVSKADQIGAGPKSLSGPAPVQDVSEDNSLYRSVAEQRRGKPLPDYSGPRPSTRMENAARQSNNSRVLRSGETPIALRDRFTDLTDNEYSVATEIAGRMLSDRRAGIPQRGSRVTGTSVRRNNVRANNVLNNPIRSPQGEAEAALAEALRMVRGMKSQGLPVDRIVPRMRIVR